MEFPFDGNFNFQAHASLFVRREFGSIANCETTWSLNLDLKSQAIDLSHSFDFLELDCIAIIKAVPLVFV